MNPQALARASLLAATGLTAAGCGGASHVPSSLAAAGAPSVSATATASPAAHVTPAPTPVSTPTPTPTPSPAPTPPPAAAFVSRPHQPLAACHLVDPATAATFAGAPVTRDDTLSGSVPSVWFSVVDGTPYAQDDCGYTSGAATVRVVLLEPAPGRRGSAADGRDAFQAAEADLAGSQIALTPVSGVGDQAAIMAPPGGGAAQVIVLDHEVVFDVGLEAVGDAAGKSVALAVQALSRADSGAADGQPGS